MTVLSPKPTPNGKPDYTTKPTKPLPVRTPSPTPKRTETVQVYDRDVNCANQATGYPTTSSQYATLWYTYEAAIRNGGVAGAVVNGMSGSASRLVGDSLMGCEGEKLVLDAGSAIGALLVDGLGDGVMLTAADMDPDRLRLISFGQLQGCRMRSTKTEFVSCPSCGRTLFDLQEVTAQITKDTGHLPGVAIAVMGCIVNGPGEMADADFGYVGSLPGKIDLYVGRTVVKKNIPMEEGPAQLVQLIKDNGRWKDKEEAEETVAA